MKKVMQMTLGMALFLISSVGIADDKKDEFAKLAVGTWEVTSTHAGGPPKGGTVEFSKDGKLKVTGDHNIEGTYKIEGKKLKLKVKVENDEHAIDLTIDKLDDKNFAMSNEAGKVELTRKK
ncbi:MAG: hypothetical protein QM703_14030 [Gemmatales bacterium]